MRPQKENTQITNKKDMKTENLLDIIYITRHFCKAEIIHKQACIFFVIS